MNSARSHRRIVLSVAGGLALLSGAVIHAVEASSGDLQDGAMVQPQGVQDRRVHVGHRVRVLDGAVAELFGRADDEPAANPSAGQPHREPVRVVVAADHPTAAPEWGTASGGSAVIQRAISSTSASGSLSPPIGIEGSARPVRSR